MGSSVFGRARPSLVKDGRANLGRFQLRPRTNILIHPLLGLDDEHDSLVHHSIRPPSHGHPLMDDETYLSHHQLPLVHRGRPCEGATMWKINVYIYIITILYMCNYVFFSLSLFFFFATCRILIRRH